MLIIFCQKSLNRVRYTFDLHLSFLIGYHKTFATNFIFKDQLFKIFALFRNDFPILEVLWFYFLLDFGTFLGLFLAGFTFFLFFFKDTCIEFFTEKAGEESRLLSSGILPFFDFPCGTFKIYAGHLLSNFGGVSVTIIGWQSEFVVLLLFAHIYKNT